MPERLVVYLFEFRRRCNGQRSLYLYIIPESAVSFIDNKIDPELGELDSASKGIIDFPLNEVFKVYEDFDRLLRVKTAFKSKGYFIDGEKQIPFGEFGYEPEQRAEVFKAVCEYIERGQGKSKTDYLFEDSL